MGQLEGKIACITGAASGIGRATARLLAGEGAAVVVADVARKADARPQRSLLARIMTAAEKALVP